MKKHIIVVSFMIGFIMFLVTSFAGQTTHSVTLNWTQSTTAGITTNCVYRSTTSGTGYSQLFCSLAPMITYTDNSVAGGTTYYYVVTALAGTNESNNSNQVTAVVPANPNPPAGLTATVK